MTRQRALSLIIALVLFGSLLAALTLPVLAKTSRCLIINPGHGAYASLQAAQDAANTGDTLWVRGTCVGPTTITRSLMLLGQHPNGFTAPTLDGDLEGSVLTVASGVSLSIADLTITDGFAYNGLGAVEGNLGGGILDEGGTVILTGDAVVSGNTAGFGGGIFNDDGNVFLNDLSVVSDNNGQIGGGIRNFDGTITLNGSSTVRGNTAIYGAGIANLHGVVNVNDGAGIDDNVAISYRRPNSGIGGGIVNGGGSVRLNDNSTISGNSSSGVAGGVMNYANSTLDLTDNSSIASNTADGNGGGVFNIGAVSLNNASNIDDNAAAAGGGIFNAGGDLINCVDGVNVSDNTPDNIE